MSDLLIGPFSYERIEDSSTRSGFHWEDNAKFIVDRLNGKIDAEN